MAEDHSAPETNTVALRRPFMVPSRPLLDLNPAEIYRTYGAEVAEAVAELRATIEVYRQMWRDGRDNRPYG